MIVPEAAGVEMFGKRLNCFLFCISLLFTVSAASTVESLKKEILRQLGTKNPESFTGEFGESLLHLALQSGDLQLIRMVDSACPRLREFNNSTYDRPLPFAIAKCPLRVVALLDTLGFDFYANTREQVESYWPAKIPSLESARKRLKNISVKTSEGVVPRSRDPEAEAVYAYVLDKLSQKKWSTWENWGMKAVNEAQNWEYYGYTEATAAVIRLLNRNPGAVHSLFEGRGRTDCSPSLTDILTKLNLPAHNSRCFFASLTNSCLPVIETFIDKGAIVNDQSIQDGKLVSALTFATTNADPAVASLLKQRGASDSLFYELLVPGYWPSINTVYRKTQTWYTVRITSASKTSIISGPLNLDDFALSRTDYWSMYEKRALFMVATNKPEGITKCITSIAGPKILKAGEPLTIELASKKYQLSVPGSDGILLRVSSFGQSQDLFDQHPFGDFDSPDTNSVFIIWAGDIDNDSKLDIVLSSAPIDVSENPDVFYLYISTLATNGLLLGKADESRSFNSYEQYSNTRRNNFGNFPFIPWYKKNDG